ncbi:MAG: tRNA (guanosine(37)-N1)-methyltransferase TrmD [bacterium]|nr:tRNA (guanosine(37)-N1)-methyltransferase TrmD [bacterium]
MIKFDIITIFPNIFESFFGESLIARARIKGLVEINVHNLREWADDKHSTVDDKPFGGGFGMVMKVGPIFKAVKYIKKSKKSKVILFTPRGRKFNQKIAAQFSKLDQIIMICGRYEGVDERVAKKIADIELSIGDYVLMGGEIPALAVVESVSRLIPGVLGKAEMVKERSIKGGGFVEYAQYTRPEVFNSWKVPKVLLSGNHKKIEEWRSKHCKEV